MAIEMSIAISEFGGAHEMVWFRFSTDGSVLTVDVIVMGNDQEKIQKYYEISAKLVNLFRLFKICGEKSIHIKLLKFFIKSPNNAPVKQEQQTPAKAKAAQNQQKVAAPQQKQPGTPQTKAVVNEAQPTPQQNVQNNQVPESDPAPAGTDNESMDQNGSEAGTEGGKKHRWFGSTKKPSVRAKERKIRQNRRLRKILIPKNALMALHELKGISMSDFEINNRTQGGFSAKVTVNNMEYEGIGSSKTAAKNNACEKALRDHIIVKMISSNRKKSLTAETTDNDEQDVEMKDGEEDGESKLLKDEEDVPMLNLASFALFKLFTEWESEGFEIPEFRPTVPNTGNEAAAAPPTVVVKKELPPNYESMHPASLLCIMRPGIQYTYLGGEGQPPKTIQRVGVCVDGQNFIGEGRSQKIARRNAATQAANGLFGTNFATE